MKEDVFTVAEALKNAQKSRKSPCNNFFQMVHNQKNGHPPNYAPQNIRGHEPFYYLKHEFWKFMQASLTSIIIRSIFTSFSQEVTQIWLWNGLKKIKTLKIIWYFEEYLETLGGKLWTTTENLFDRRRHFLERIFLTHF